MTAPGASVVYLPTEQREALEHARHLAVSGVPLFLAEPVLDSDGNWVPTGGGRDGRPGTGYHLPAAWQKTAADPRVVDRWRVGMALCAVMGHTVDGVDVDPRNGGDVSLARLPLPRSYGRQLTPNGGTHDLIAALGRRSRDKILPGIDYKAGVVGEGGHGFLFLAPTVKARKDGSHGAYTWETPPDLTELVLVGPDDSGVPLEQLLDLRTARDYAGPAYAGPGYERLSPAEQAWARDHVAGVVDYWRALLAEAADWPEGRADAGRGWELLARNCAWALAVLAATPWTGVDEDAAELLYDTLLPAAIADDPVCGGKWYPGIVGKAAAGTIEPPPWDGLGVVRETQKVDAGNPAVVAEWLRTELGAEDTPLAGMFRRGEDIIHTPRVGEDGYVPLTGGPEDADGPAQVRPAGPGRVQSRVQFGYRVTRFVASRGRWEPCLLPMPAVQVVMGDPFLLPNLRPLRGVTHTPMLRADGSVLREEGYDAATQRLYLPEAGLTVGPVRRDDVGRARALLEEMLADFPWNTVHDRANYLALLLTPLMRELVPPPYKLGAINAHQRGSGKSLLAWILRTLHGGVLRGDVPGEEEEFRKQITTILTRTTAPVVQFDNVRTLRSTHLDAVLTSDSWSDRELQSNKNVEARNDRLWLATGNNIALGGDLVRRVLWVTIDPQVPNPEARTNFAITDLKAWVRERRGDLLWALLVLLHAWVEDGRPTGPRVGSDDFSRWIEACRAVLAGAGIDGVVGHEEAQLQQENEEDEDWAAWLAALHEHFGSRWWTTAEVVEAAMWDSVPEGMNISSPRSIGKWLASREGQWAGGYTIKSTQEFRMGKKWKVNPQG